MVTPGSKISSNTANGWIDDVGNKFPWAFDKETEYVTIKGVVEARVKFTMKV